MTVRELLARLSSEELAEWMAYSTIDMLPGKADDWRAAMIAATVSNANRSSESEPANVDQFMPRMPADPEDLEDESALQSSMKHVKLLAYFETLAKQSQTGEMPR